MKLIVVVDDEYALAEALAALLEEEGFRVLVAQDGAEGLTHLVDEVPALCFVDLMMPVMGGVDMVRAMRADPRLMDVPVVLMTAARRELVPADLPVQGFLRKPFSIGALIALAASLTDS